MGEEHNRNRIGPASGGRWASAGQSLPEDYLTSPFAKSVNRRYLNGHNRHRSVDEDIFSTARNVVETHQ